MPIHGYPGNVITANPTAPTVSSASGVWTTEQQLQAVSQGNWPGYEYPISRSLRFNSADSTYLNRTPASASNRTTWTWSGWVKRARLGALQGIYGSGNAGAGGDFTAFGFNSSDQITFYWNSSAGAIGNTTAVFRDLSAWYHIVVSVGSGSAKIYVNGTLLNTFSITSSGAINNTTAHALGAWYDTNYAALFNYSNCYLTEINFIDGQALTPSSFGLNDPETGVWSPKQYTGTYGTNGFYVNFSDNSNTTAATLGKDYSGNGNNWTPNNFSVTAGAGNDSLVDSPTSYGTDTGVGGEVRGNYCTLNPTDSSGGTISNGNLDVVTLTTGSGTTRGTIGVSSGKWYWEGVITSGTGGMLIGILATTASLSSYLSLTPSGYAYSNAGNKENNSTATAYGASYTTNDVIGVALDMDAGTLVFYKNGASQGTAFSSLSGTFAPGVSDNSTSLSSTIVLNFGQRAFAYTAPSGFKALCTQNLPTPTIGATSTTQANDYFNVVLWTGNATARNITGVGFQPDMVWSKERSSTSFHEINDAVRGANKQIFPNSTDAEETASNKLTAFISDGFSVGDSASINENAQTYVAWNWKANGAGSSNTAGTITSTVSASTTAGFSVVTWTGNATGGATIGHGLGVAPSFVISKRRDAVDDWSCYHVSLGGTKYIDLNSTAAAGTSIVVWNNTNPSSTVVTLGTSNRVNASGGTYVAYCFAPVAGYSAFGSYTGNGSNDGPFVFTGLRPRYVLIKTSTRAGEYWVVYDTARNTYNLTDLRLFPNLSNAEGSGGTMVIDILSNGFKIRGTDTSVNSSGDTYIYACFAENPFKYSLAR